MLIFLSIFYIIFHITIYVMQPEQLAQLEREVRTFAVTNYILNKLRKHGINDITNLKLQKILYIAYGLHWCLYGENLFDSQIQAWRLGPVVPDVYNEFRDFSDKPIITEAGIDKEGDGVVVCPTFDTDFPRFNNFNAMTMACVIYGNKKASTLVNITHKNGSAWKTYEDRINNGEKFIPMDINLIRTEFENIAPQINKKFEEVL